MKIRFNLARKNAKISILLMSLSWKGHRLQLSSGLSIEPKKWDIKNGRVKSSSNEAMAINTRLNNIRSKILMIYNNAVNNEIDVTKEYIKSKALEIINPPKQVKTTQDISFLNHYEIMMSNRKKGIEINNRNGKPFGKGILKTYQTTLNHLKGFEQKQNFRITFDSIDEKFYRNFVRYLLENVDMTNNTVGMHIKNLKTFMKRCVTMEFTANIKFMKFKVYDENSDTIALTKDELGKIIKYDTGKSKKLSKVKDLFLILCFSGLRYSDLKYLTPESIDYSSEMIRIISEKTKVVSHITLHSRLKNILIKYPNGIPKISAQKFNDYMKELAKLAEINTQCQRTRFKGNDRIVETFPKYELISSHTGRRTYITLSLIKNIPTNMIMRTTGHKSEKSFQKYIRLNDRQQNEVIKSAWD